MARGRFITFEGIDGSGKSTALRGVAAALEADGLDILVTREETPSWTGDAVRRAIEEHAPPLATTFLFLADRARHVPELEAALAAGRHVLCDRFHHSTYAYQSVTLAGEVDNPLSFLRALHAPLGLVPDHTILLDIRPDIALRRVHGRGAATPYEKQAFLGEVAAAYRDLAAADAQRFTVIDGDQEPDAVLEAALRAVRKRLA